MKFKTWDSVVTYVYWLNNQLPPSDPETYKREKDKIIAYHKEKGYELPESERE